VLFSARVASSLSSISCADVQVSLCPSASTAEIAIAIRDKASWLPMARFNARTLESTARCTHGMNHHSRSTQLTALGFNKIPEFRGFHF
jgi:hypothetical protein